MRYSLYINQPVALELGIENATEAIIFDFLTIASTWAKPEIINNKVYYWVARQKICKEHEILHIQPKTVYRYFRKLHQKGLIDYKKLGKKDCIAITDLGKTYISNTMGNVNSSTMGILKSQEEEFKIQSNGNLKSTYKYTNPIHLSDNTLSPKSSLTKKSKPEVDPDSLEEEKRRERKFLNFVNQIREQYKPEPARDFFPTILEQAKINEKGEVGKLKIDNKGHLYVKYRHEYEELPANIADKFWRWLFDHPEKIVPIKNQKKETT